MSLLLISEKDQSANASICKAWLDELAAQSQISEEQLVEILERCYYLFSQKRDPDSYNTGLGIICHVADRNPVDPLVVTLLDDCISASGNFPYNDMLRAKLQGPLKDSEYSIFTDYRRSYYTTEIGTTLTKDQKKLFQIFRRRRRIVASAPTSFGKSKLIDEILLESRYKQSLLVLPTIALLSETFRRLRENRHFSDYHIYNSVGPVTTEGPFIFILTPERADMLLDMHPEIVFEFFVMDEVYKIQDDLERREIFTNVLYRLARTSANFYIIGPYYKSFSSNFLKRFDAEFQRFESELVQKEVINLSGRQAGSRVSIGNVNFQMAATEGTNLKRLSPMLVDATLFYVSKRNRAESIAKKLSGHRPESEHELELVKYIEKNISKTWSLVTALKRGVAFHHSSIPRYIQTEIIELFNRGEITGLVCTTTITEGVNTAAKNVVILDSTKGDEPLTGFDVKNIKGRAGRFFQHFVGRVVAFHELPDAEKESIEFRYLDVPELSTNEVLQLADEDLTRSHKEHLASVREFLALHEIPEELIKKNRHVAAPKQWGLISRLRRDPSYLDRLSFEGGIPTKYQLSLILELCFEELFSKRHYEHQTFTLGNVSRLLNYHVFLKPSIKQFIATQPGKKEDTRIRNAFYFISQYLEFALPTYFSTFETLFNFVATESQKGSTINLAHVIARMQFGYLESHEIAMKEAGLPNEIIDKVGKKFAEARTATEISVMVRMNPQLLSGLSAFERGVFSKHI